MQLFIKSEKCKAYTNKWMAYTNKWIVFFNNKNREILDDNLIEITL
jgi:hypothetical protein